MIHYFLWWQDDIESNEKFQALQEELIAVKLREAESNLALRELSNHVAELDKDWQVCVYLWTFLYRLVDWLTWLFVLCSTIHILFIYMSPYRFQYLPFRLLGLNFRFMCRKLIISIFICLWNFIHDLKVTCTWLVSVMFIPCICRVHVLMWLVNGLHMLLWKWLVHDLCVSCRSSRRELLRTSWVSLRVELFMRSWCRVNWGPLRLIRLTNNSDLE